MQIDDSAAAGDPKAAGFVPAAIAQHLLAAAIAIGDNHAELADRRQAFLTTLADMVAADSGFWAWGRGKPGATEVAPLAIIDFGFTDSQRTVLIEWGLSEHVDRELRGPIMARMGAAKQSTVVRRDLFTDEAWDAFPHMRRDWERAGWGSWLHSVRYSDNDTWSNFFLLRNLGREEFGPAQAAIVDLSLAAIPWLQSTAEEFLPPETFVGLTPRQRAVMLLLLDGLARKTIAQQLDISEDTVGDHIKSIYAHFGVNSAGELAALFLRSR